MKKIMLILAGALCISAAALAQDPTPAETPTPPDSISIQPSQPAYLKDMVKVEATEIPEALKSTLQGDQFKGWQSGAVYRNQAGDMFIVEINDPAENRVKAYRFDASGQPIKDN